MKLLNRASAHFRRKRLNRFLLEMRPRPEDRILDVGGHYLTWLNSGLESQVTILNIALPGDQPEPFRYEEGDACDLSKYENGAFDIVFSNSVIEHVGPLERQQAMAAETARVGRRFWVQTPYLHFPIEPHFAFPGFQYVRGAPRRWIAKHWPFSFAKSCNLDPVHEAEHIWLLDRRRFRGIFPGAKIISERVFGLPKSLIAVKD